MTSPSIGEGHGGPAHLRPEDRPASVGR
jgi:hypothetical protein